jgi:uncharacterized protein YdaU (DUF1376 family)
MHYYQHNIADYRKDTIHLTLLEHGCYRQLIDQYYLNEEPLPLDLTRVFRLLNARSNDEQTAIKNVINDFFTETENGFIHTRCDLEIQYYRDRIELASKAGKASAVKRKSNDRATDVQQTFNQPITNNLITNNQLNTIVQNDFDLFWNNYPKKTGKEAARKSFNKIRPNIEVVLKALEWQKKSEQWFKNGGQFIPNPATWINQHRWNDEPPERVTF